MLRLNFVSILGIAAVLLNLMLVVKVAAQPTQDRIARTLLVVLLLCSTALMMNHLYRYRVTRLYVVFPHFAGATVMLMFCLGPALYAYVRRLALGATPWQQRFWILHWLLPIAVELYLIPRYGRTAQEKFAALRSVEASYFRLALYLANYLQIVTYIVLSHRCMGAVRASRADHISPSARDSLDWSTRFCWGLTAIAVLGTAAVWSGNTFAYSLLLTVSALFGFSMAYSALGSNPVPAQSAGTAELRDGTRTPAGEKYARSGLQGDTARYYLNKLQSLMTREQYFLDESLSLASLAERVNLSAHHLSQLLNEQLQTTFYAYINAHRIEYAKQLLRENPDKPIVDIATGSGYDNKGTFYSAFKRQVGMTPAQYRNQSVATGDSTGKSAQ